MNQITILFLLSFLFVSCSKEIKTSFNTYNEFREYQEDNEYLVIGKFNMEWPAKIVLEQTAMNKIVVDIPGGKKHTYQGFDGYELKVIRLQTNSGKEAVIVLRSEDKE